jgi:hypothetical protein
MRAKNRSAGLDCSVSLQQNRARVHISNGHAVAAYPIPVDFVRLPLGYRA